MKHTDVVSWPFSGKTLRKGVKAEWQVFPCHLLQSRHDMNWSSTLCSVFTRQANGQGLGKNGLGGQVIRKTEVLHG